MPEEAAAGPRVGVVVVGDVAHVTVDVVFAELGRRHLAQALAHVGHVLGRRGLAQSDDATRTTRC